MRATRRGAGLHLSLSACILATGGAICCAGQVERGGAAMEASGAGGTGAMSGGAPIAAGAGGTTPSQTAGALPIAGGGTLALGSGGSEGGHLGGSLTGGNSSLGGIPTGGGGGTGGTSAPETGGVCPSWQAGCPCEQPANILDTLCLPRLDLPPAAGAAGTGAGGLAGSTSSSGAESRAGAGGATAAPCPPFDEAWWDNGSRMADGSLAEFDKPCGWTFVWLDELRVTNEDCCYDVVLACDTCV